MDFVGDEDEEERRMVVGVEGWIGEEGRTSVDRGWGGGGAGNELGGWGGGERIFIVGVFEGGGEVTEGGDLAPEEAAIEVVVAVAVLTTPRRTTVLAIPDCQTVFELAPAPFEDDVEEEDAPTGVAPPR